MSHPTSILGVNAWHGDASACLLVDGELVAAVEEERFRRVKHWAGFPAEAARFCLKEAGIEPDQLGWIAVNRDPRAALGHKVWQALRSRMRLSRVFDRLANARRVRDVEGELAAALGLDPGDLRAEVAHVEHHRAHLASSFLVSPFEEAALVSVDGFGDFASAAWGTGHGTDVRVDGRVRFPHSLGLFYMALTQYLGFPHYGDEFKVMGLAAHGRPRFAQELRRVLRLEPGGSFALELAYFRHHRGGVPMTWEGGAPVVGRAFSTRLEELLGPARRPDEPLAEPHADLAASIQLAYEEALFHLLRAVADRTGRSRLCLSGGCAMNGLANGRITSETPFSELYVPPAPGDAGGAIGAALEVWCGRLDGERRFEMRHAYLGPRFEGADLAAAVEAARAELESAGCRVERLADPDELCRRTAARLDAGGVVGWFQDRMEWGPRALGNRSILADPRRADVRDLLNAKIKLRESFRPFAPSILREEVTRWFDHAADAPFMLEIRPVRPERRDTIPAVTHADGTGRLQTVDRDTNPLYHRLISAFAERTGVPVLLNTSFNENEPVVCRPEEALACFLRTRMDALVLGDHLIERRAA